MASGAFGRPPTASAPTVPTDVRIEVVKVDVQSTPHLPHKGVLGRSVSDISHDVLVVLDLIIHFGPLPLPKTITVRIRL